MVPLSNRKFLGVVYSAIFLGITVSPYVYLCSRVVTMFPPQVIVFLILWLVPCTVFLLTAAFSLTGLERGLKRRLRLAFAPLFILCLLFAAGSTLAILAVLSTFTLFERVEYWHSFIVVLSATIGVTLLILVNKRPTRLESALTRLFDRDASGYRILGVGVLLALLAAVVFALYRYHLFKLVRPV
ncbi:MAG TPA: hypothetical protein VKZ53_04175 [Candidatus Angelobacter sp.]|nr:hypothetical protein [Candidatus Angelobacter sp.]